MIRRRIRPGGGDFNLGRLLRAGRSFRPKIYSPPEKVSGGGGGSSGPVQPGGGGGGGNMSRGPLEPCPSIHA